MEKLTWFLKGSKGTEIEVYMWAENNIALRSSHIVRAESYLFGGIFYDQLDFIDCALYEGSEVEGGVMQHCI